MATITITIQDTPEGDALTTWVSDPPIPAGARISDEHLLTQAQIQLGRFLTFSLMQGAMPGNGIKTYDKDHNVTEAHGIYAGKGEA